MPNTSFGKKFDQQQPGIVVMLLDQSGSMESIVGGKSKARIAADAINRTIDGLIERCRRSAIVENKVTVCVVGYGAKTSLEVVGTVSELDQQFRREEEVVTTAALPGGGDRSLVVKHK